MRGDWDEASMARLFSLSVKKDSPIYPHFLTPGRRPGKTAPQGGQPRSLPWVMALSGGTLRVSQTFPPMVDPLPIVTRPKMVAPA